VGGSLTSDATGVNTLIQHWDGNDWTITSSPNGTNGSFNLLYGVTCTSSQCIAVGFYYDGVNDKTLVETWNRTSWAVTVSPDSNAVSALYSVSCVSDSDCTAVGTSYTGSVTNKGGTYQTLIEHWNGVIWTISLSADSSATSDNVLLGVTCSSSSNCWAAGYFKDTNGVYQGLLESWNGTLWSIVPSPAATAQNNLLSAVTCDAGSDCWAVGRIQLPPDPTTGIQYIQTLIERWDNAANQWSVINSANSSATELNGLAAVACVSDSSC
jgi:hypothetical protein